MKKKTQLMTIDDAVPAKGQHKKPCSDCPWARTSVHGWLGSATMEEWSETAHGEARMEW